MAADTCTWRLDDCADDAGFIAIDECLRAAGGPGNVFAVGDVATSMVHPRPKAGVYAVRQGPPLTDNLRRWVHKRGLLKEQALNALLYSRRPSTHHTSTTCVVL
jgi:selenide,water dikinase